ncbi:hypothetical protein [Neisseria polysaccharea]|uniref:hypothetical protein n=1 Tax=Neisseria polysaccharea TaxID=489 RepID=UPI002729D744|nr:hypothetical protein [Neisseria polysaccharea]
MRETCFRCKYADFKTQLDTPMRGFAKCAKARNAEEKATYYPRTNPCVTGAFQTASEAAMRKRRQEFGEPAHKPDGKE